MAEDPPRAADLAPGEDKEDPYEGEDISAYPEWWRETVEEFRRHEMRPYRPPRFADGELVPPALTDLQKELGVEIRLRAVDPEVGQNWEVFVDGEYAADVRRRREGKGFTEYAIKSTEFESLVRSVLE